MESFCCFEEKENNFYNEFDEKSCLFFPWLPATIRLASKESKQDEREIMKKSFHSLRLKYSTILHFYTTIAWLKIANVFSIDFSSLVFFLSQSLVKFPELCSSNEMLPRNCWLPSKVPRSIFVITRKVVAILRNLKASVFL